MGSRCHLAALPAELIQEILYRLDIRSAGRLALTCRQFADSNLLQSHQYYPFFSAVQRADASSLPTAFARLVSRSEFVTNDAHSHWHSRPDNDQLVALLEACIWVLVAQHNSDDLLYWSPIRFLSSYHFPANRLHRRCQHIENAVITAYRRNHFRGIKAMELLCSSSGPVELCSHYLQVWPLIEEICARPPIASMPTCPQDAFTAQAKLCLLETLLRLTSNSVVDITEAAATIAHPSNTIGMVVQLAHSHFSIAWSEHEHECLLRLLDACGKHNRPDLLDVLMQLYLLGRSNYQPEPADLEHDPPGPEIVPPGATDELFYSLQAQLAAHGVPPGKTVKFQGMLTKCSWHRAFVPYILGIAGSPKHPHLAIDWFRSHACINLLSIHYLPLAIHAPLGHLKHESARLLLGKFPIDIPPGQTQHGPKAKLAGMGNIDEDDSAWVYEDVAADCGRCADIRTVARAASERLRLGRPRTRTEQWALKEMIAVALAEDHPDDWLVYFEARPERVVREEYEAARELLVEAARGKGGGGAGTGAEVAADDWLLADWAKGFLTGAEVYELWTSYAGLNDSMLAFPIPFAAAMNALVELQDFEHALRLLLHEADEDGRVKPDWLVSERAVDAMIRALEPEDVKTVDACLLFISAAVDSKRVAFWSGKDGNGSSSGRNRLLVLYEAHEARSKVVSQ